MRTNEIRHILLAQKRLSICTLCQVRQACLCIALADPPAAAVCYSILQQASEPLLSIPGCRQRRKAPPGYLMLWLQLLLLLWLLMRLPLRRGLWPLLLLACCCSSSWRCWWCCCLPPLLTPTWLLTAMRPASGTC